MIRFTADEAPHANCARSFVRLFRADPAQATEIFEAATQWILTGS